MYQATIADDTQRVADSKMVEEEDNSNQKPEKMIKEVRKNMDVTELKFSDYSRTNFLLFAGARVLDTH